MPNRRRRHPPPRRSRAGARDPAIEDLQQRCAELYDDAPVAYVTLDLLGIIRDLNLPACSLIGIERRHAVGMPSRVFVAPTDPRKLVLHLGRFREEHNTTTELRMRTRRAGSVWVELRSRATVDGRDLCFTSIINQAAQKRAEEERRRLE